MKASLVLAILMMLFGDRLYAQGISIASSSTPSICYNDGTLTVSASGGSAPYSYSITSGPYNLNITYPIILASGHNVFTDLPHGSFTLVVTDASGASASFTVTVGGTYQFPSLTVYNTLPTSIAANVSGGLSPYQYSLSDSSANTGFGPYQSADSFTSLCPGNYWVRVKDSCQNIYTAPISVSYQLGYMIQCVNFSKGTLDVIAYGGNPPYTYQINGQSNTTGSFTGLPAYSPETVTMTDSCGQSLSLSIQPFQIALSDDACTTDSAITVGSYFPSLLNVNDTLTFICTNCIPAQSVTEISNLGAVTDTLFRHIIPGQNYNIVILNPDCGGDTIPYRYTIPSPISLTVNANFISCNSFYITTYPNSLDSAVLVSNSVPPLYMVSYTGYFYDLPDGLYTVTAYGNGSSTTCFEDFNTILITLPFFPKPCQSLMMDSACQQQWEWSVISYFQNPETFSLIYPPSDTVAGSGTDNYFYGLSPDNYYTLLSDSGCSELIQANSLPAAFIYAVSSVPCTGKPVINISFISNYTNLCNQYNIGLYFNGVEVDSINNVGNNWPYQFSPQDTGWYVVRLFTESWDANGNPFPYNSVCPIDTNLVYVTDSHIPYPFPSAGYVCDSTNTDTVTYHIYGGQPPYTVDIIGYNTITLATNAGTFPTNTPGQYTMVVYDNCGISRSISFAVLDTCHGCPISGISLADSAYCAGDTVSLGNTSLGGDYFEWLINGAPYSSSVDTIFITPAGSFDLLLAATGHSGCIDSAAAHFTAANPVSLFIGADTNYCDTFSRVLSTGIPATIWSTGQMGPQITATSPGQYIATVTNQCGVFSDTINIASYAISGLTLNGPSIICDDWADSVTIPASVSSPLVTFIWSTGQADSAVYTSFIRADSAGSYKVIVLDSLCNSTTTLLINAVKCDSFVMPDIFTPNGDGVNDEFIIPYTGHIYKFSMHIYNRWGQLVYESTDIDQGWDGNYRGEPQPQGVYVCFLCIKETGVSSDEYRTGTITLTR